ncbi:hypothetical protein [Methylorubrum extorquens]
MKTLDAVIRVEEAYREALMRDLLDLAERGQETAEVLSELRRTEDGLAALRERRAHPEVRGRDQ